MAKRKHPAALFEVIHTAPPPPLSFTKPKRLWWFGYRSDSAQPQTMRSLNPAMIPDEPHHPASIAPARSAEAQLRARFADAEEAQAAHEVAVFSADEPEGLDMADTPARPASAPIVPPARLAQPLSPMASPPSALGITEWCAGGLRIDRDRQEFTIRLRYTTAALAAFIALVLLGLAFVVGKRLGDRGGDDIAALRNGPIDPAVMSVGHNDVSAIDRSAGHAEGDASVDLQSHPRPSAAAGVPAAAAADAGGQRTIGLDYLVVQSYPDKKSAQDAADMLTQGGVACTVEHGIRFAPNWFSVVTLAGYPPHDDVSAERLADSIRKVAAKDVSSSHHYRFSPQGYQWNQ